MAAKSDEVAQQHLPLHLHAGHLIRRLNQRMLATFAEKLAGTDVSNVQFAALEAINILNQPRKRKLPIASRWNQAICIIYWLDCVIENCLVLQSTNETRAGTW